MVCHHHVHDVFGPSLRHVAADAVAIRGVPCQFARPMTLRADLVVADLGTRPMTHIVRVVASSALQLSRALDKAGGSSKAISHPQSETDRILSRARCVHQKTA